MAVAMAGLREAHLYRQRTNEVGIAHSGAPSRRAPAVVAGSIVAEVLAGNAFFLWAESHGDRCIGGCG